MNRKSLSALSIGAGKVPSPLRRKSMAVVNMSLLQNDDEAERMERRKLAEEELLASSSTARMDGRLSMGGAISSFNSSQLADHYTSCIKLYTENKINVKNAFKLHLLEYMSLMVKKKDSDMNNFQVAGCTLDAVSKIYGIRVDSVHSTALQIAGGLGRKKHASAAGADSSQMEEDIDPKSSKKKAKRHLRSMVATNLATLDMKTDEDTYISPSFLRLDSMTGDSRIGDYNFLSRLRAKASTSELQLSTAGRYWSERTASHDPPATCCKPALPDLTGCVICPTFSAFSFTKWSVDDEDSQSPELPSAFRPNLEHMFDMEAVPEPVPPNDTCSLPFDGDDDDADTGFDVDGTIAMAPCAAPRRIPEALVDLRNHLSTIPQEYSYFKPESMSLWAGPGHWRVKLPRHSTSRKEVKKRQKKYVEVDMTSNIDSAKFVQSKNIQLAKKTLHGSWSSKKITQLRDTHYDQVDFFKLYFRPKVVLMGVDENTVTLGEEALEYNYDNDNDRENYCPNVIPESADEDDDHCMDQETLHMPSQDVHTVDHQAFTGDNLVEPPNKVARVFVPYATRAKKIDMKKLKSAMWGILTDSPHDKENYEARIEKQVQFSHLYKQLPGVVSPKMAENLSCPLVFAGLLHLCNEQNLCLKEVNNLSDVAITQD